MEARIIVLEIACDLVVAKEVEITGAWLEEDEAANEFETIPDGWIEDGTL